LGSVAVAANVTFVPPATTCEGLHLRLAVRLRIDFDRRGHRHCRAAPLLAVSENPSVTGAMPTVNTGAVNVGASVSAEVSETPSAGCVQRNRHRQRRDVGIGRESGQRDSAP